MCCLCQFLLGTTMIFLKLLVCFIYSAEQGELGCAIQFLYLLAPPLAHHDVFNRDREGSHLLGSIAFPSGKISLTQAPALSIKSMSEVTLTPSIYSNILPTEKTHEMEVLVIKQSHT